MTRRDYIAAVKLIREHRDKNDKAAVLLLLCAASQPDGARQVWNVEADATNTLTIRRFLDHGIPMYL